MGDGHSRQLASADAGALLFPLSLVPQKKNPARGGVQIKSQRPLRQPQTGRGLRVFHLTGEMFKQAAGIDILHVPYKGTQQALTDTMSGQNSLTLAAVSGVIPLAKSGKLKLLAVLEAKRFALLPDVPTVGETLPGFEKPASWFGFFGPAVLPQPIVFRVHADVVRGFSVPEVRNRLEEMGLVVIGSTPAEFAAILQKGYEIYGRAAKAAGIKPE